MAARNKPVEGVAFLWVESVGRETDLPPGREGWRLELAMLGKRQWATLAVLATLSL